MVVKTTIKIYYSDKKIKRFSSYKLVSVYSKILEYKKLKVIHFEHSDYFSKFFCTTKLNYLKGLTWIVLTHDECVQQIKRKHNFLFIYYILWTSQNRKCDLLENNIHLAESFCNTNLHYLNGHNTATLIREYAYFFSFHPPIYYKTKHSQTPLNTDTSLLRIV